MISQQQFTLFAEPQSNLIPLAINTGIKSLDATFMRHSIQFEDCNTPLQKVFSINGQARGAGFRMLPFCMQQIVLATPVSEKLRVMQFSLPYKNNEKFACFLFNEEGELVEQVCYQRKFNYVRAFKQLMQGLVRVYSLNRTALGVAHSSRMH